MKKIIRSDGRKIIYNVYQACIAKQQTGSLLPSYDNVYALVAMLTGKSERTVRRIIKEGQQNDGIFVTPVIQVSDDDSSDSDDNRSHYEDNISSNDEVATTSTPNEYFEDVQYLDFDDL